MKRTGFKLKKTGFKKGSSGLKSKTSLKSGSSLRSKKTNMKSKSTSQNKKESEYKKVLKENFEEDELCTGCRNSRNSTPSHLVSRQRRPDLVTEIENLRPHCVECHQIWEKDPEKRKQMLDYKENLGRVKKLDYEFYKILTR